MSATLAMEIACLGEYSLPVAHIAVTIALARSSPITGSAPDLTYAGVLMQHTLCVLAGPE